jgi:chemotaxis family two-component system response regulator Rcp1
MSSLNAQADEFHDLHAITVLMVEDDPDDVYLTEVALRSTKLRMNLHVVNDGVEAMRYLRRTDRYAGVGRPDLILLDLNLPLMDGQEVLVAIKEDPALTDIPVVVLTTSTAEGDILASYRRHANCYISKPVGFEQFQAVVASIETFWFTVVSLPSDRAGAAARPGGL